MKVIKTICSFALSAIISINLGANAIAVNFAQVQGKLSYPRLSAVLGQEAIIYIALVDVSPRQDSSGDILARVAISRPTQSPIFFKLQYNLAQINPKHTYVIQARITQQGKVIYANTSTYPVITRGNPSTVDIVLAALR